MTEKAKKSDKVYLLVDDLSYVKNGNLVLFKKDAEKDVFLDESEVPQEALNELIERELVKVIAL